MRKRFRLRAYAGLTAAVATVAAVTAVFAGSAGAIVAGAGFTTNDPNIDGSSSCLNGPASATPKVNCNLYGSKNFVWINGGPSNGANALTAGTYFFAVLDPGGQQDPNDGTTGNLSDVSPTSNTGAGDAYTAREFTVASSGKIATFIGSGHTTDSTYSDPNGLFINLMPYDDTANPGGVYILAICQLSTTQATSPISGGPVTPSACKFDAFKAPISTCSSNCTPSVFGVVSGEKYYDANLDGQLGVGESGIAGWKIDWHDGLGGTITTDANGQFSQSFTADTYTFTEEQPTNPQHCVTETINGVSQTVCVPVWLQTGNTVNQFVDTGGDSTALSNFAYTSSVVDGGTTSGINFGNVCTGAGNGLTLGFWSNKNGAKLISASDLAALTSLNLRTATGANFDPTTTAALQSWLLKATATNMAYMLSAQLAAMELNTLHGQNSSALVYAPHVVGATGGFITIAALMSEANNLLGNPIATGTYAGQNGSLTVASSALRSYQETVKNGLDEANNNVNFLQATAASCAAPTFAP
jgi:hypothetical protein